MKFCPICKRNWEDDFRVCPIDGLALQAAAVETDPRTGRTVGQTHIAEKISDGDLGPIYRAQDTVRGQIAVQFVPSDRLSSPVLAEAFEDAVRLASKVSHPNIVGIYSIEHTPEGETAVLMEYVKGSSLAEYRKNHPSIDVQQACQIVKEAGQGVSAAHRASMLHGSIQPTRILISADGKVKVAGFHRSGTRDDISPLSPNDSIVYIAPERVGIVHDVAMPDYRADVYSLGVILYELLTGKLPYEAKNIQELQAVMDVSPPLPPTFSNPQVPPALARVVLKAISRAPGDRYRTVEEFTGDIEAASQPARQEEKPGSDEPFARPGRVPEGFRQAENEWQGKKPDDGSFFGWFKTRSGVKARGREPELTGTLSNDSVYGRKSSLDFEDGSEERTVLATGKRNRPWRRQVPDSPTDYRGDDLSSTGLPERNFSGKAYIWMGVAAFVLLAGIAVAFWFFRGEGTGKLRVQSQPSGARVYLNQEYLGPTLLSMDVKPGIYRLRLEMEGYDPRTEDIEITPNGDVDRSFTLVPRTQTSLDTNSEILQTDTAQVKQVVSDVQKTDTLNTKKEPKQPFAAMIDRAVSARNFFPPTQGNAWDILQSWKKSEAPGSSPEWEQSRLAFCKEIEIMGGEKLEQKDFQYVRNLLAQIQSRMPDHVCANRLQTRFDSAISQSISELRGSVDAAMGRQQYVTPEDENALKYLRLILNIDPQDSSAKAKKGEILTQAFEQARSKSLARRHQEAFDIYSQLKKNDYPDLDVINKSIERESQKLQLLNTLNIPYSVQVKHGHSILRVKNRQCSGILRVVGFTIEYQSTGDHSFKVAYDNLKSVSFRNGKLTIESNTISDGKRELEQVDKNPSPSLQEVYNKIEEYRKIYSEYAKP